ncbi:RNA exonuclease 4 [Trichinella nativa]|uniref:RNA exonuclease 4 n=2 Tax=Trichinella TaxID=6333 RepID=A0A0V1LNB8_9BILA|nr:RNA exonuclease 4 [Trichinella murrelli]KRZ61018.1 RNA exonuclease 4 [Trichinella nativa]KRZ89318.1 RNA exonuclease 4 [Trichinella sp. T8]
MCGQVELLLILFCECCYLLNIVILASLLKYVSVEEQQKRNNEQTDRTNKRNRKPVKKRKTKKSSSETIAGDDVPHPERITKIIALDCEFVGSEENDDLLARVSICNSEGKCVYDKFVKPNVPVKDYRTAVSGVRKKDIINADSFDAVQREVCEILKGRVLVGHNVSKDLSVLALSHSKRMIRDTSTFPPFRSLAKTRFPKLKTLAKLILGMDIQSGEHCSIEDARATMFLYNQHKKQWEKWISKQKLNKKNQSS